MKGNRMLYEEPEARELLRRVVFQVCREPAWQDDLMQEANIHLWWLEVRRPGQTLSWYIQGCRFHLLNHLAGGRSVDSPKRRARLVSIFANGEGRQALADWEEEHAVPPERSGRDIIEHIQARLTSAEKAVLRCLADGRGVQETARLMGISHQAVSKHRSAIARQLGGEGVSLRP